MPSSRKPFLHSINHFRGVAILFVLLVHYSPLASWSGELPYHERVIKSLIGNGTIFFAWITGYLFEHVYVGRFEYLSFMKKKLEVILLPFLCMSLIPGLIILLGHPDWVGYSVAQGLPLWQELLEFFWYGRAFYPYWYIPMILVFYAISPWVVRMMRSSRLPLYTALLFVPALLLHRPINNQGVLQALLYFLPVFLFGATCSVHQKRILPLLKRFTLPLFLVALGLALFQAAFYEQPGTQHKVWNEWGGLDISMIQKCILCLAVWGLLDHAEDKEFPLLVTLAKYSFGIYFLHPYVIYGLTAGISLWIPERQGLFWAMGSVVVISSLSLLLSMLLKRLCGKQSRRILGA